MAIFCITTSNPKFQKLLAESGEKQGVFAMMVSKWMTENEVYDRYPTLQELGITAMDSIKPGVEELFDSNQSLANAVYEALGFNVDSIITIKESFNPDIPEATTYALRIDNKYAGLVAVDNNGTINSSISQTGVELEPEFRGKGFGKKIYLKIAQELLKQGKTLKSELFGKDNINEDATRVWKSLVRDGYAVDKGGYYEIINTLTPQQKQQAQQLYSQYLDTIFPDSQLKDIFYHGARTKFDKFDFNYKRNFGNPNNPDSGMFFVSTENEAGMYGSYIMRVLLNAKNIKLTLDGLYGDIAKQYKNEFDAVEGDEPESGDWNTVVFKPEQIHILGSEQDIEGFKKFVGNVEDVATDIGLDMSSDEAKAFNSLVNDGTISIKCE